MIYVLGRLLATSFAPGWDSWHAGVTGRIHKAYKIVDSKKDSLQGTNIRPSSRYERTERCELQKIILA